MLSFKDKTFCNAKCSNMKCHRKLTDTLIVEATIWWGDANFPVAMADFSGNCKEYQPIIQKE